MKDVKAIRHGHGEVHNGKNGHGVIRAMVQGTEEVIDHFIAAGGGAELEVRALPVEGALDEEEIVGLVVCI